ncbi:MAG: flagellar filament capping protein FliD [Phycisphaeraceae bacterium]
MTITSGVGLISGIPIADLIDQLMALEARPKTIVENRNAVLQAQQIAFQDINAKLLSLKFSAAGLTSSSSFNATTAATSDESAITVSSGNGATPGTYQFTVNRLVGSQQTITRGFIDTNATPITTQAATLTFENARARLDAETLLSQLNGGDGISRGFIRITDRSGASALIDLTSVVSADEVVQKINTALDINVIASVNGDAFQITDNTGSTLSNLIVQDVGLNGTATSLGIAANVAADTITGTAVNTIGDNTLLASLNDGNGVGNRSGLDDLRLSLQDASTVDIDLDGLSRLEQVIDAINTASAGTVTASVDASGTALQLTDNTSGVATFVVSALNSSTAAADLGILGTDDDADGVITGQRLVAAINSKLLRNLNGGTGVGFAANNVVILQGSTLLADLFDGAGLNTTGTVATDILIRSRQTAAENFQIDVDALTTVQDLIDAFDSATAGKVTLSIEDNALRATDNTGGTSDLTIADINASFAIADLGLTVINAPVDTVLGVDTSPLPTNLTGSGPGPIDITNRAGVTTQVDLSTAASVSDMLDLINAAAAGVTATLNDAGYGILLTDTTGGSGNLTIADVGGGITALSLGIAGSVASDTVDSGSLQFQYITESSRLTDLGVASGKFIITDSSGVSATVDLTQGNEVTIADVLAEINSRGLSINARINDNGDGILIEDTGPGTLAITVEESGSTTARDLGILGQATAPGNDLDGSFEKTISIAGETLLTTTTLSALNGGDGVNIESASDDFSITTRDGTTYNLNLDGATTIQDVIDAISTATAGNVTATINSLNTGLRLSDSTSGSSTFEVKDLNDSTAATDLGILKADGNDDGIIDGGTVVEVTTLQDLVNQINDANVGVAATIINDGSTGAPFRLSLTAETAGKAGGFIFDDGTLDLAPATLAEARDAVVFFGSPDTANAIIITSSSNTLNDVIPGATLNLHMTSDSPVEIAISRDDNAIVDAVSKLVTNFNSVIQTIDNFDSFNSETEERGLLLGDPTANSVRAALFRMFINRNTDLTSQFSSLSQIGITVSSGGAGLDFDESKFRNALDANRDAIEQLFTFKQTDDDNEVTAAGIGVRIDQLLERLTDANTGLVQNRVDALDAQVRLNNDRIEQLDVLLAAKRARLEFEFVAMERALATLQTQSLALASFRPLTFNTSNSNSLF